MLPQEEVKSGETKYPHKEYVTRREYEMLWGFYDAVCQREKKLRDWRIGDLVEWLAHTDKKTLTSILKGFGYVPESLAMERRCVNEISLCRNDR